MWLRHCVGHPRSQLPRHAGEGRVCLLLAACPGGGGWGAGSPRILAEQTHGPLSTLSPLCTQGVRPGSTELHFMVTKITMPPSRNCQQRLCAQVFGPIFAEPEEPRLLCDIDLDSSLTRNSGVPMPACPSSRASARPQGDCLGSWQTTPLAVVTVIFPAYPYPGVRLQGRSQELQIA